MRFSFLKALIAVEVMLAFLAVFLYLDTKNDGGFEGLVVMVPIFGMAAVGLLAFPIFVLQFFDSTVEKQTAKSKISRLGGLCIFGFPVYHVVSSATGGKHLIARLLLVFMITLGMYILIDDKLDGWKKPYEILLLLFAPFLSLIFAFSSTSPQDFHWVVIWLVIGFGIFGIGSAKILRRK